VKVTIQMSLGCVVKKMVQLHSGLESFIVKIKGNVCTYVLDVDNGGYKVELKGLLYSCRM
jgi:hypothetical protein